MIHPQDLEDFHHFPAIRTVERDVDFDPLLLLLTQARWSDGLCWSLGSDGPFSYQSCLPKMEGQLGTLGNG